MVTKKTWCTLEGNSSPFKQNIRFSTATYLNKCLKVNKLPISPPITELHSNISTMIYTVQIINFFDFKIH